VEAVSDWLGYCLPLTKASEGCRLTAYADPEPGGILWTVGYGATGPDITEGTTWTQEQADADLADRLQHCNAFVTTAVRVRITQMQRAALDDFAYNVGRGAFAGSTLLAALNRGDYQTAADEFLRWNKDDGRVEQGLLIRRANERELFRGFHFEGFA